MSNNADSRSKLETARQQAVAEQASREAEHVTPVRSAKDAINAMYAQDSDKRLSSYLAKSAKEIINSSGTNSDQKSAASLHQHATKRRIETERPSASGILRVAPAEQPVIPDDISHAMDPLAQKSSPAAKPRIIKPVESVAPPIIKTSLKLGPKKTPAASSMRASAHLRPGLNGQKGRTALSQFLANRRTQAAHTSAPVSDIRPAVSTLTSPKQASTPPKTAPSVDHNTAETLRAMRQAVQQTTGRHPEPVSAPVAHPQKRTSRGSMQDIIRPPRPSATASRPSSRQNQPSSDGLPADSVKHRFRAAPKGYTAAPETQQTSYTGFRETSSPKKPPVEIYGLMDDEPTGKHPELPVIEDYKPSQSSTPVDDDKSPDNNKYTLKGQSPFFLKSVNVEKRPLSSSVGSKQTPSEGTLYERPATTPVGGKNLYDRKEARKALPTKPTVIIPASRRSRAPLIFLLILTVILGAAVGAFVYLCFFQYME